MGKGHRTCEVCGIRERYGENSLLFSSFPLEPNRCREWLKVVGKEDLVYLPLEKLHKMRYVCADHFEKKHFNKNGNRLKRSAIPTLNLKAAPLAENLFKEYPQNLNQPTEPKDLLPEAEPSTSQQGLSILGELSQNERTHSKPKKRSGEVLTRKAKLIKLSHDKFSLTAREKKLMEQLRETKCSLASLRRSANILEKWESYILKEIVTSYIKNQKRKPKGRRWIAFQYNSYSHLHNVNRIFNSS